MFTQKKILWAYLILTPEILLYFLLLVPFLHSYTSIVHINAHKAPACAQMNVIRGEINRKETKNDNTNNNNQCGNKKYFFYIWRPLLTFWKVQRWSVEKKWTFRRAQNAEGLHQHFLLPLPILNGHCSLNFI